MAELPELDFYSNLVDVLGEIDEKYLHSMPDKSSKNANITQGNSLQESLNYVLHLSKHTESTISGKSPFTLSFQC